MLKKETNKISFFFFFQLLVITYIQNHFFFICTLNKRRVMEWDFFSYFGYDLPNEKKNWREVHF